jgi:uncharacterized protein
VTNPSAGALLRDARRRSGLTQAELAERAGTTQSVISAYESDRRRPALATLAELVKATGLELEVRVRARGPIERRPIDRLTGPVGRRVRRNRRRLVEAAAARGITNLRVFGSVARGEDRPDSDVDILAEIPDGLGLLELGRAREEFERILDARVDLVSAGDLKPGVARRVTGDLVGL